MKVRHTKRRVSQNHALSKNIHKLFQDLSKAGNITALMQEHERQKGFRVLSMGERSWYAARDWHEGVISTDDRVVRIVAICAIKQGRGAFSRMIEGIIADGLVPVVLSPFPQMESILVRWGWKEKAFGSNFEDRESQWAANWSGDFAEARTP